MARFVKVATTDRLEDQQAKLVEVESQKIALLRVDGTFYALSDTCTHRGGPLSEGTVEGAGDFVGDSRTPPAARLSLFAS
jgi:nitrite reductase/ring-hydroxylating ferredoxin subunit